MFKWLSQRTFNQETLPHTRNNKKQINKGCQMGYTQKSSDVTSSILTLTFVYVPRSKYLSSRKAAASPWSWWLSENFTPKSSNPPRSDLFSSDDEFKNKIEDRRFIYFELTNNMETNDLIIYFELTNTMEAKNGWTKSNFLSDFTKDFYLKFSLFWTVLSIRQF